MLVPAAPVNPRRSAGAPVERQLPVLDSGNQPAGGGDSLTTPAVDQQRLQFNGSGFRRTDANIMLSQVQWAGAPEAPADKKPGHQVY